MKKDEPIEFIKEIPKGTSGIPKLLNEILIQSNEEGFTKESWLSQKEIIHFKSKVGIKKKNSDSSWGCGYRNLQMMFSCIIQDEDYLKILIENPFLRPNYDPSSHSMNVPSISQWQHIIQAGWDAGFDRVGAMHFDKRLVGKFCWIGTTEIYVALHCLGIRCQIVDFVFPPDDHSHHIKLMTWVKDYFGSDLVHSSTTTLHTSRKLPLYLQYAGHSLAVVGLEISSSSLLSAWNLLILDPANDGISKYTKFKNDNKFKNSQKCLNFYRFSLSKLCKRNQYQILFIKNDQRSDLLDPSKFHQIQSIRIS